jgi:hypothetical protein
MRSSAIAERIRISIITSSIFRTLILIVSHDSSPLKGIHLAFIRGRVGRSIFDKNELAILVPTDELWTHLSP